MTVGENIRRMRKKRGLTQKELGERLGGISQQQIGQWENGGKNPKFETIMKIAAALSCAPADLTDNRFDLHVDIASGGSPLVIDGILSPQLSKIEDFNDDVPFHTLTEYEKVIVYYNSLNDDGKDKVIEYFELLLSNPKYRNFPPDSKTDI